MLKEINIIAFDVPFPANYGGVIDVFYKIKHLHQKGIKVHLHCFEYGKGEQQELNKYCESVNYYKRKRGLLSLLASKPYIVKSRESKELKKNLLKNDFPILFEGLHTCFLLDDKRFKNRFKIVRHHNVEHDYYEGLALSESNPVKRNYYKIEAIKLERFQHIAKYADVALSISEKDLSYFKRLYPGVKNVLIPAFHQNKEVSIRSGKGDYVLYHGNLSVAENVKALEFIVTKVFNDLDVPLIIAGLNPTDYVVKLIEKYPPIRLVANPSDTEMNELIAGAQINFLYTEQATGLKLKLLNVLFKGRFCIANTQMLAGTSLHDACIIKDNANDFKTTIQTVFNQEMDESIIEYRKEMLKKYSNEFSFNELLKAFQ